MFHKTLRGKNIDLQQLPPRQLALFVKFFKWAGGEELIQGTLSCDMACEPDIFLRDCELFMRLEMGLATAASAIRTTLGEILVDLALRLGIAKGRWTLEDVLHNPRLLLRQAYLHLNGLRYLSNIDFKHFANNFWKATIREPRTLPIDQQSLNEALDEVGFIVELVDADATTSPLQKRRKRRSCHEIALTDTSQRVMAMAACVKSDQELTSLFDLELRAKHGTEWEPNQKMLQHAFWLAKSLGLAGDRRIPILIGIDRNNFENHTWLPVALEFHWFEQAGYIVVLVNQDSFFPINPNQREIPLNDPKLSVHCDFEQLAKWHFAELFEKPVQKPIQLFDDEAFTDNLALCRAHVREFHRHPELRPLVEDVIARWRIALCLFEPPAEGAADKPFSVPVCRLPLAQIKEIPT